MKAKRRAFTLIELLVVIGLIAALAAVLAVGLRPAGQGVALQAGQSAVANLLNAARLSALATGHDTRVLLCVHPASADDGFLRRLAWQEKTDQGWITQGEIRLPDGVAMLPRNPEAFAGLLAPGAAWTRGDGAALRSTAFRPGADVRAAVNSPDAADWAAITLSSAGTTMGSGDLVLGAVVIRPPSDRGAGQGPVRFVHPDQVRGLSLSGYGLATLVNSREGF
jgi:prepilin-type N-terminal cleavage/methylation domain-containing protein